MIGLFSAFARASASGPHAYQSTGLYACWRRYGLCSLISRFGLRPELLSGFFAWLMNLASSYLPPRALSFRSRRRMAEYRARQLQFAAMRFRLRAGCVLILAAILFFARLGARALWSSEFRWAEIAREMLVTHNYFWPTINGHVYYDKPLGSYWLVILSTPFTGGLNEAATR